MIERYSIIKRWYKLVPPLVLLFIFSFSFPIIPFLVEPFTYLKYVDVSCCLLLCVFLLVFRKKVKTTSFHNVILFLSIYGIFSFLWAKSPYRYLNELFVYLFPLITIFLINVFWDRSFHKKIVIALIFLGNFYGIYGIFQFFHIDFPFFHENIGRYRIVGWFGNPIYFTEYLLPLFIFSFALFIKERKFRWFSGISLFTTGFTIIVSLSRGAWVGMFFGILFVLYIFFGKEHKKLLIYTLLVLIILFSIFMSFSSLRARFFSIFNFHEPSVYRRFMIWLISFDMIKDHPLLGVGIGNFRYFFPWYQAKFFSTGYGKSLGYPEGVAFKAHNDYIQILAELGIVGFLLFIFAIYLFLKNLDLTQSFTDSSPFYVFRVGFSGGVVALLFEMLTGFPLRLPHSSAIFWFFIGMSFVGNSKVRKNTLSMWWLIKWILLFFVLINFLFSVHNFFAMIYEKQGEVAYFEHKDLKKAEMFFKAEEVVMPIKGEGHYYLGVIDFKQGKILEGIREMEEAQKNFDHPEIHASLGYYYLLTKRYKDSIREYKKAIMYKKQKDPKYKVKYLTDIGLCYRHLGDFKKAEYYYREALSIDPEFVNAIYNLGILYDAMGKKDLALSEFKRLWDVVKKDGITEDELLILKRVQELGYLKLKIE